MDTSATNFAQQWLVWQLADATFPAGGLAHSGGLEAARQWGEVFGAAALGEFLEANLGQAARGVVPFMLAVHRGAATLAEADRRCDVFLSNHVANRASRSQGKALLLAAEGAFGLADLSEWRTEIREQRLQGHFAPLFGAVTAALALDIETAARLVLYNTLRSLLSSAVRLNIVGPLEAQAMQFRFGPFAEKLALAAAGYALDDVAQTAPVLEILQATQDRLYSRLFQS